MSTQKKQGGDYVLLEEFIESSYPLRRLLCVRRDLAKVRLKQFSSIAREARLTARILCQKPPKEAIVAQSPPLIWKGVVAYLAGTNQRAWTRPSRDHPFGELDGRPIGKWETFEFSDLTPFQEWDAHMSALLNKLMGI